jgi:chromosome segregation ATPase
LTKEVVTLRNQQRSKIVDARRSVAEDSVRKYEQANGKLTEQLAAAEQKYCDLYQEKKYLEEKYHAEGETYHKMTAAFTSISEELIGERKAKRAVEDRLREEQEKCRNYEAEIQDLKAELGRISLFS